MKNIAKEKQEQQLRRRARTGAKIFGTEGRPRLSVGRTLKHIYVQLIDDSVGKTLVYASDAGLKAENAEGRSGKIAQAYLAGKKLAELAHKKGIKKVVFDRAHRKYHGRVMAVAEGAREGGLEF
jgi:large subunit ribosomal protein L18